MSIERFIEELQFSNEAMSQMDEVLNEADITDDSYLDYVLERVKTASTSLTKAGYYFTLIPPSIRRDLAGPLVSTTLRLKKTGRGLFLWILHSRDYDFTVFDLEGGEDSEISFSSFGGEDVAKTYTNLCQTLDITKRLVHSEEAALVRHGHGKIIFMLGEIEDLFDVTSMIDYATGGLGYMQDHLADMLKVVEKLNDKAKWRLKID